MESVDDTDLNVEFLEPIVNFLSRIRKLGMDILWPQLVHDKVLVCMYVSAKFLGKPVAHRELIDTVMAVKDILNLQHFENVSKTKIRGLLALLKHCEVFIPYVNGNDPVKLQISSTVTNYKILREIHDDFLFKFLIRHHLAVPRHLLGEILWEPSHSTSRDMEDSRLTAVNKYINFLVEKLEANSDVILSRAEFYGKKSESQNISSITLLNTSFTNNLAAYDMGMRQFQILDDRESTERGSHSSSQEGTNRARVAPNNRNQGINSSSDFNGCDVNNRPSLETNYYRYVDNHSGRSTDDFCQTLSRGLDGLTIGDNSTNAMDRIYSQSNNAFDVSGRKSTRPCDIPMGNLAMSPLQHQGRSGGQTSWPQSGILLSGNSGKSGDPDDFTRFTMERNSTVNGIPTAPLHSGRTQHQQQQQQRRHQYIVQPPQQYSRETGSCQSIHFQTVQRRGDSHVVREHRQEYHDGFEQRGQARLSHRHQHGEASFIQSRDYYSKAAPESFKIHAVPHSSHAHTNVPTGSLTAQFYPLQYENSSHHHVKSVRVESPEYGPRSLPAFVNDQRDGNIFECENLKKQSFNEYSQMYTQDIGVVFGTSRANISSGSPHSSPQRPHHRGIDNTISNGSTPSSQFQQFPRPATSTNNTYDNVYDDNYLLQTESNPTFNHYEYTQKLTGDQNSSHENFPGQKDENDGQN